MSLKPLGLLFFGVFIVACAVTFNLVNEKVTEPFIDEIFHIRQCQKYCAYKFNEWDSKITTPPGLYLLGLAYVKVYQVFNNSSLIELCDNQDILRSLNLFGGIVVLPIILYGLQRGNNFLIVNIVSLPLVYTYYFLFYTDIWATILIVFGLYLVVREPLGPVTSAYTSALVAFISLWFRQTNILWVIFIVAVLVDQRTPPQKNFIYHSIDYVVRALQNWVMVLPFVLVTISFALFVVYNGGITLGDKENHTFNLHLVQVFYCFLFMTVFTLPVWFHPRNTLKKYIEFSFGSTNRVPITLASFFVIKLIIEKFTVVHPFLLADNRHYTFYIYRKLLRNSYSWVYMLPIYHFCSWNIIYNLQDQNGKELKLRTISIIAFIAIICITIIPSPLFEPRYYILPLTIYRIFISPKNTWRLSAEFAWSMLINAITVTIFLNYEFSWATETSPQRIIW